MNELLARAGSIFLAPPSPVGAASSRAPAPPPDLVGVLAAPGDLVCVAGGVAAGLRRRHRARAAVVCTAIALPSGRPATRAARTLAARLHARELSVVAAGAACLVALPGDPELAVRDAWRAVTAGAGYPAIVALCERTEVANALLAQTDLLLLAAAAEADPAFTELALASLAALGPPSALVRPPAGFLARRLAAAGLHALAAVPDRAAA